VTEEALGLWLLAGYAFERYRNQSRNHRATDSLEASMRTKGSECLLPKARRWDTRLESTTPFANGHADQMALEAVCLELQIATGPRTQVIHKGQALLEQNFPMIHAVGARAASQEPRLSRLRWGCIAGARD